MKKPLFFSALLGIVLFLSTEGACQGIFDPNIPIRPAPALPDSSWDLFSLPLNMGGPPPGPVHCCAEWEESEGIILNYNWKSPDTLLKMVKDHQVHIPVDNKAAETAYRTFLKNNGIPLTNIHFIPIPLTYGWMRDCGPWFIWNGNNELCIVNNNCWHDTYPLDDRFPQKFAALYGYRFYEPAYKIYCEGGNYYPNAYGVAFSSSWVYGDNGAKSKAFTDSLFRDYYGIEHYRTVPPFTLSHHDTCGKPSNPETLIIANWPKGYWKHPLGQGIAAYYETLESPWGRPYKIHRIPMFPMNPGDFKPYLNCLVANKKVFVPITNTPDDKIALGIFQDAFEGYEIVGVDGIGTGWGASLHCATKNIFKRDVIRIYPLPPGDTEETKNGYPVTAEVIPPKGSVLSPGYPVIRWTDTGGAPFNDVKMLPTGKPNEYGAEIPAQPQGVSISFYVEAQDTGGLSAVYPLVAPKGMMRFEVKKDIQAPELSRFVPTRSASAGQWPPLVRTLCKDDMATPEVCVEYAINGAPQPDAKLTREELCYWYSGTLAGQVSANDLITYRIKATDNADQPNASYLPKLGKVCIPVCHTKEGVGIVNLSLRPFTAPFLLDALGDLGIPHHYYREWPQDFREHEVWFICLGVFPYNQILTSSQGDQIVNALKDGSNIYLEGGDTWCYDPERFKISPWFGIVPHSRGWALDAVFGEQGTFLDGFFLKYGDEVEDLYIDRFKTSGAKVLLKSNAAAVNGVTAFYDAGNYRVIGSSIPLGGLRDKKWPNTRKEILLRYLEFFGMDRGQLMTGAEAFLGDKVPVRIQGTPGEEVLLLASLAEDYLPSVHGVCRLSLDHLFTLGKGVIPGAGVYEFSYRIPRDQELLGMEVHLQALVGAPLNAKFTNRDILTFVK